MNEKKTPIADSINAPPGVVQIVRQLEDDNDALIERVSQFRAWADDALVAWAHTIEQPPSQVFPTLSQMRARLEIFDGDSAFVARILARLEQPRAGALEGADLRRNSDSFFAKVLGHRHFVDTLPRALCGHDLSSDKFARFTEDTSSCFAGVSCLKCREQLREQKLRPGGFDDPSEWR